MLLQRLKEPDLSDRASAHIRNH